MKQLTLLNWIVFGVGAAILFLLFFLFLENLPQEIFWLDLIVCVLAYGLIYFRAVQPMVDLDDPAHRQVGYLGLSFVSVGFYAVAAILCMIFMQYEEVQFKNQLFVQIILAFLLLLTFMVGARISDKTVEVFNNEQKLLSQLDSLRRSLTRLERTVAVTGGCPASIGNRVSDISSRLRYIAPCNNLEAVDLEAEMIAKTDRLNSLCSDYESNADAIEQALLELDHLMSERKSIYFN
ncbi:MAG: hypothetical protein NC338_01320 [Firmicutes bacterium]|nr:hypothetical protein [Bacillota bacterium]MCM1401030.1 hypothetical protein [Bacteroides sp.]MCM1476949.1 hypothetical protein [Bacteroides sp.]